MKHRTKSLKSKSGDVRKSPFHPQSLQSPSPIKLYHFQADLLWCDGTLKASYADSEDVLRMKRGGHIIFNLKQDEE
jgi:hypothetical protein